MKKKCLFAAKSQYLVWFLFKCTITGGKTIHPPIEGLSPPIDIEPTTFQNFVSKVAGVQVHVTAPSLWSNYARISENRYENLDKKMEMGLVLII